MKRTIIYTLTFVFMALILPTKTIKAQVLDGIYEKEHVPSRRPVPYSNLREADVLWKKRIWRCLDLRQKMNFHFYFPTKPIEDRRNLSDLLFYGQTHEGVVLYNPQVDDRFSSVITTSEIESTMGAGTKTKTMTDENGNEIKKSFTTEINWGEIKLIWLKEDWYFDKQLSRLEVRLIGIMPIRVYIDETSKQITKKKVFWAYYPAVRPLLANHAAYNRYNDAQRKTYDDIFFKRFFASYIVKEANVYEDRPISSYRKGTPALWESQNIKNRIFNMEQDFWEY